MNPAPTIVAFQPDSAWIVIPVVSLVTLPVVLLFRRVINRPGGLASGALLTVPLALPLVAAFLYGHPVFPEIAVLHPVIAALQQSGRGLGKLVLVTPESNFLLPRALKVASTRWLVLLGSMSLVVVVVRSLLGTVTVRRLLRRCRSLESLNRSDVSRTAERLARAAKLEKPPEVLVLPPEVQGAFATGWSRCRILISEDLVQRLDDQELEATLAHEVAHIGARDLGVLLVARLLRGVVAWNPAAYWAFRRLAVDRELEADRIAARLTGRPLAVASGLLKVCELTEPRASWRTGLGFGGQHGRRLQRRVSNLLALADGDSTAATPSFAPFIAAAVLTIALVLAVGEEMDRSGSTVALVWGTPRFSQQGLWIHEEQLWAKANARERQAKRPNHRLSRRPVDRSRPTPGSGVLKVTLLDRADKVAVVVEGRGGEGRSVGRRPRGRPVLGREHQGWRAVPLIPTSASGGVGVYRIDPQVLLTKVVGGH